MSDFVEVFPTKIVAVVVAPLVLGLLLLALLFRLGPLAWALILLFVIGSALLVVFVVARAVLLEKQRGPVEAEAEAEDEG